MSERLPDHFDPVDFADKHRYLTGAVSLISMERVRGLLLETGGSARTVLEFAKQGRLATVTGQVDAELVLQCQCCLEPMTWLVNSKVSLAVVRSIDEADRLPDSMEALMLDPGETTVGLVRLVEDELLLSIPDIPRHPDCRPRLMADDGQVVDAPDRAVSPRKNPFADLAQLKSRSSQE